MNILTKYLIPLICLFSISVTAKDAVKDYHRSLEQLAQKKDSATVMTLAEKALKIRTKDAIVPIKDISSTKIFLLSSQHSFNTFTKYLSKYSLIRPITATMAQSLLSSDILIVPEGAFTKVASPAKTLYVNFEKNPKPSTEPNTIYAYSDSYFSQIAAAEAIFGALDGKRLSYGFAQQVGMNADTLAKIDVILRETVESGAAPGVQVLVARKGKIVYHKSYGTTMGTYSGSLPVDNDMIYDMASVTKVMAALPFVMKLYDEGKINLNDKLGDILPEYKGTNKENMILSDILTHRAGLKAWIPTYLQTIDKNTRPLPQYYRNLKDKEFAQEVVNGLYAHKSILDTIKAQMIASPVKDDKKYVYSDFAFFLMREIAERYYGKPLEVLVQEEFYKPIGAKYSGYRPLERFAKDRIVPSENDRYWRGTIVQGYVHDMAAAFMDGVSGHAGLFSTAEDMAKMAQMYLNWGNYGYKEYIKPETVKLFAAPYYKSEGNYRGLGFDRPAFNNAVMSQQAFGHTGFTGTAVWIDPEQDLVYVFLSNRTFESMDNNILSSKNIRGRIQKLCYNAIIDKK